MNKYFKNFILVGDIDHHCLLCKETFQLITDIEKHIRWEKHRQNIKVQNYLPKFGKDCIFKIENSYYCEICNYIALSFDAICQHVREDNHKTVKNKPDTMVKKPIGQCDSGYVKIGKVALNKHQWHCIVDKKCLLCAVDVKKVNDHITTQNHIIRLIQSATKIDGDRFYRKINDDLYQCFSCKKTFSEEKFAEHCKNETCENLDLNEINKVKQGSSKNDRNVNDDTVNMDGLEKKLIETLNDFFCIDEKNNLAACKHCKTIVGVNLKAMIEHMKNEHDGKNSKSKRNANGNSESSEEEIVYREVADHGKRRSELSQYGKEHFVKLNFNCSKGFCTVCNRYISAHKNVFKEHARGAIHKSHLELKGDRKSKAHGKCNLDKVGINNANIRLSVELGAFWVESEFCIDVHSFLLLYVIENNPHCLKTICLACDETLDHGKERDHCISAKHRNKFFAAKIVLQDEEFIREIRPNLYHCGVCNQTIPFWDTVLKHIKSWRHKCQKNEKWVICGAREYWHNYSHSAVYIKPTNNPQSYNKLLHV